MKKTVILFDIDYTLFNTDHFRDQIYKKFAKKLKIKFDQDFLDKVKEAEQITKHALGTYEPAFFIKTLIDLSQSSAKPKELEEEYWKKENFENSLYPDVHSVLMSLSKIKNLSIGILSTGDTNFQRKKIDILKKILDDEHTHIFVDKLKEIRHVINKYKNFDIFLVDDLLAVLELAKKIRSDVKTVHMIREKSWEHPKVDFKADFEFASLEELVSIILKS